MLADLQAVLFDLDGTLLDRRRSFEHFIRDQWKRFFSSTQTVDLEPYVETLIELDRDGYTPRKELFTGMAAQFGLPAHLAERLLTDFRAGFPRACLLFPDAIRTLSSIRAIGLKLGLITNGSVEMQSSKLQCLALASVFDAVLISDAEGLGLSRLGDHGPPRPAVPTRRETRHGNEFYFCYEGFLAEGTLKRS